MAATFIRPLSMPLIKTENGYYSNDDGASFAYQAGGTYLSSVPTTSGFNVSNSGTYLIFGYVDITFELGAYPVGIALQSYAGHTNSTSTKVGIHTFDATKANIIYSINGDKLPSLTEGNLFFKTIRFAFPGYEPVAGEEVVITGSQVNITACTCYAGEISEPNRLNLRMISSIV